MEYSFLEDSFPGMGDTPPGPPPPALNGGRYTGAAIPPGAPWGPVPVRADAGGMMRRLREDGPHGAHGGAYGDGTFHFTGGAPRPGNHPGPPPEDLVSCAGGSGLCVRPDAVGAGSRPAPEVLMYR